MHELESPSGPAFLAGRWPLDASLPTLIFIHGAGSSGNYWTAQLTDLLDVANTLAVDLPGHGRSPGAGKDNVPAYTRVLVELVAGLGPPRPVPVGFSMGGAIALQALLDHPNRFPAAVLIATGAKLRVNPLVFEAIEKDYSGYVEMKAQMAASSKTPRELIQPALDDTARQNPVVALGDFRACDVFDVRERLPEIHKPVLVISAEEDRLTPPKFGKYLAEHIQGAAWMHQHEAGHLVAVEKPEEVNQAIREFVKKL